MQNLGLCDCFNLKKGHIWPNGTMGSNMKFVHLAQYVPRSIIRNIINPIPRLAFYLGGRA